jgi:hypothetical protein
VYIYILQCYATAEDGPLDSPIFNLAAHACQQNGISISFCQRNGNFAFSLAELYPDEGQKINDRTEATLKTKEI